MRFRVLLVAAVMLTGFLPRGAEAQEYQDVVYLHDGSIIRGMIVEQIPNESLLIRTADGSQYRITMDRVERITREPVEGEAPGAQVTEEKNPAAAMALSFLLTGGGQFYNGQPTKGLVQLGLGLGSGVIFLVGIDQCYYATDWDCTVYGIGLAGLLATKIWSMADAWISAEKINQGLAFGVELDPAVGVSRNGGVSVRLLSLPH